MSKSPKKGQIENSLPFCVLNVTFEITWKEGKIMNNNSYHNLCNMFSHMCNYNSNFYDWIVETIDDGKNLVNKGKNCGYIPADTMKKILRSYGIRSWNVRHDTYENLIRPERRTMSFLTLKSWEKDIDKIVSCVWIDDKTLFFKHEGYYYTITAETERNIVIRCYTVFNENENICENCIAIGTVNEYKDILHFARLYITR